MRSRAPHIPDEIILNVLSRLPVKSLLRFKCVSKLWNSLISDPTFALSDEPQRKQAIVWSYEKESIISFHSINSEFVREELPFPLENKTFSTCRLLGSCQGLLLLSFDADVYMWNPLTRKCVKVLEMDDLACDLVHIFSGFCHNKSGNDYIAVMGSFHSGRLPRVVFVASMKGKIWNEIKFPYNYGFVRRGPFVNERLHWLVCDTIYHLNNNNDDDYEDMDPDYAAYLQFVMSRGQILCFDPQSSEFNLLPVPDQKNEQAVVISLGVLEDCLCMVYRLADDCSKIMIMREYGVKESWTSLFVIPSGLFGLRMICSVKDEQVLMVTEDDVSIYDPVEEFECSVWVASSYQSFHAAVAICESLVSPSEYRF